MQESGIIYHNHLRAIILMKNRIVIVLVKKDYNLIDLKLSQLNRVMIIINKPKILAIIKYRPQIYLIR